MAVEAPWIEVTSRAEWRAWLEQHHDRHGPIWLVTFKKHARDRHLPYDHLVEEALCFGWVDSTAGSVDAARTRVYVCRRKPGSVWSAPNKRRIEAMEAAGLMTPAGRAVIDAAIADGSWTLLDDVEALIVPDDLARALDAHPKARDTFDGLSASARKRILWWVKSAARDTTRAQRIEHTVREALAGRSSR